MSKAYDPKDFHYQKAKKAGLRARSAFKIEEIVERFKLAQPGSRVLDLGAAPGGFLQVLAGRTGSTGRVVGVDLEPIRSLPQPWVKTKVMDLLDDKSVQRLLAEESKPFDLVTSDMAPKTTGIRLTDEARSLALARIALQIATQALSKGGGLVIKVFMGGDLEIFKQEMKTHFDKLEAVRPSATRGRSVEIYLVGLRLRHPARGGALNQ